MSLKNNIKADGLAELHVFYPPILFFMTRRVSGVASALLPLYHGSIPFKSARPLAWRPLFFAPMEPTTSTPAATRRAIFLVLACCALAIFSAWVVVEADIDPLAHPIARAAGA